MAKRKEEIQDTDVTEVIGTLETAIEKEFGRNSVMRLSSPDALSRIDHWVSTGSFVVDKVLLGGRPIGSSLVPFGRQMEISGEPGVGKSTLVAQIAAQTQRIGGIVAVTDTEERIDEPYWRQLGVNTDMVLRICASTIEDVFRQQAKLIHVRAEMARKNYVFDRPFLLIWDSLGGTPSESLFDPKNDIMDQQSVAKKVRVISQGVDGIQGLISRQKVAYLYTNHIYTSIGVKYGDPFETPGGFRVKFLATARIRLSARGDIKEQTETGDNIFGSKVMVLTKKNSMAPKRMEKMAAVIGGVGFSNDWTIKDVAEKNKWITKDGAWSTWKAPVSGEEIKFQGWLGFMERVTTHKEYKQLAENAYEAL